jgi:hypothetical protein
MGEGPKARPRREFGSVREADHPEGGAVTSRHRRPPDGVVTNGVWAMFFIGCSIIIMMNLPRENPAGFLMVAAAFAVVGLVFAFKAILCRR